MSTVNDSLPGILKTPATPEGLLDPNAMVIHDPLNPVTIISILVLLWSALSLMTNLRISIQAMFGIARLPQNFVLAKLLDLSGFLILGLGAILSTALSAVAQLFAEQILVLLALPVGWGHALIQFISIAAPLVVDLGVFVFLFRVMAGARAPGLDLLFGAAVGAVASSIVRYLGTAAVSSVADNPLLAPFAAIITLLLWVNLVARITLIAAAFTANPPEQPELKPEYFEHALKSPNYATKSKLETLAWDFDPMTGVVMPQLPAVAEQDEGPAMLGQVRLRQSTGRTCGAMSLFVAQLHADPKYREKLEALEPDAAQAAVQVAEKVLYRLVRKRGLAIFRWPAPIGTPPWGMAREMEKAYPGADYRAVPVWRGRKQAQAFLEQVEQAVAGGFCVPLYTGSGRGGASLGNGWLARRFERVLPRHVVLAMPSKVSGGEGRERKLRIYDPASGEYYLVPFVKLLAAAERAVSAQPLPALGNWRYLLWAVLPR